MNLRFLPIASSASILGTPSSGINLRSKRFSVFLGLFLGGIFGFTPSTKLSVQPLMVTPLDAEHGVFHDGSRDTDCREDPGDCPLRPRSNASLKQTLYLEQSSQSVTLSFPVSSGALAWFQVRYSNDNLNDRPSEDVIVSVGGAELGRFLARDTGDAGNGWNVFAWSPLVGPINLEPGMHSVGVSTAGGDGFGAEIDSVTVSLAPPEGTLRFEAESGQGGEQRFRDGASNDRTVWLRESDSWFGELSLEEDSRIWIQMRYSNDHEDGVPGEDVSVLVNGRLAGRFQALDTGSDGEGWTVFRISDLLGPLDLEAGHHPVSIEITGGDGNGMEADLLYALAVPRQDFRIRREGERGVGDGERKSREHASENATIYLRNQETRTWELPIQTPGRYVLEIQHSNDNDNLFRGEDITVRVNGAILGVFEAADTGDGGQGWDTFVRNIPPLGPIDLWAAAQHHQISLSVDGGDNNGVEIDLVDTCQGSCADFNRVPPIPILLAVTHSASFEERPVAPGEIVSIFGFRLGPPDGTGCGLDDMGRVATECSGVRVLFDGVLAPLFFVSERQINAQVPYEAAGKSQTRLQVMVGEETTSELVIDVNASAPGIFVVPNTDNHAAAVKIDGKLISPDNPAERGGIAILFGTGEGQTNPPGVTGRLCAVPFSGPVLSCELQVGGKPADVLYCGCSPAFAGLLQVNARISPDSNIGEVPVVLTVGLSSSQPGVKIAVR